MKHIFALALFALFALPADAVAGYIHGQNVSSSFLVEILPGETEEEHEVDSQDLEDLNNPPNDISGPNDGNLDVSTSVVWIAGKKYMKYEWSFVFQNPGGGNGGGNRLVIVTDHHTYDRTFNNN